MNNDELIEGLKALGKRLPEMSLEELDEVNKLLGEILSSKRRRIMKLEPGNIWSGSKTLAVFTNPTELAFTKGNLRNHYGFEYQDETMWFGVKYLDAEEAYQTQKSLSPWMDFDGLQALMVKVMVAKLGTYPSIINAITDSGGVEFLKHCEHHIGGKEKGYSQWEGYGEESGFIRCLIRAYMIVTETP